MLGIGVVRLAHYLKQASKAHSRRPKPRIDDVGFFFSKEFFALKQPIGWDIFTPLLKMIFSSNNTAYFILRLKLHTMEK